MRKKGEILAMRYEVAETLGSGGEGAVYLAKDRVTGQRVAVKETLPGGRRREAAAKEAELMGKLRHPGLPRLLRVLYERDAVCLVMEYVEGQSLRSILKKGSLPEEEAVRIAGELCDILIYLHTRKPPVCCLDLKPSNILLDSDGRVHLIDFGGTGGLTRGYAAPEQYLTDRQPGTGTDLYALGVTLHYLLTGKNPNQPPFYFEKVRKLNPKITKETAGIVERLLLPLPEKRWGSAAELKSAFSARGRKRRKRRRSFLAGISGAGILLVASVLAGLRPADSNVLSGAASEPAGAANTAFRREAEAPGLSFTVPPGTYAEYRLLSVAYDCSAGKLYYTTDGSEPTVDSMLYRDGIVLSYPQTTVRAKLMGFDGSEAEASATYRITKDVRELTVQPDCRLIWDIYYALEKPWDEPLFNYELAQVRELPEADLTEENRWLIKDMPFLRQDAAY